MTRKFSHDAKYSEDIRFGSSLVTEGTITSGGRKMCVDNK
jgi:hypothetical protein